MKAAQKEALIALLWQYLEPDPTNPIRVRTGWGTKTQDGLVKCIERIVFRDDYPAS